MPDKPRTQAEYKKERTELEKKFLSCLLADSEFGDIRPLAAGYAGVGWRDFLDRRHQVIWRAIETLDLMGAEERRDELFDEVMDSMRLSSEPKKGAPIEPGTPGWAQFEERLAERSSGRAWLERQLDAAGALAAAGGKTYLRELFEEYPVALAAGTFAKKLQFAEAT